MDTRNKSSHKEPETKNNTPANANAGNAAGNGNSNNAKNAATGNPGNGNAGNGSPAAGTNNGNSAGAGNGTAGNPGNEGSMPGNSGSGNSGNGNSGENPGNGNPNGGNNGNTGPKDVTIVVNGTPHVVAKEEMTFREIIALAELASGPNVSYTITYRRGHGNKPEGSLVEGDVVKIKDGMIFNATATDKS